MIVFSRRIITPVLELLLFSSEFSAAAQGRSDAASCRSVVYGDDIIFFITPFYFFLLRHVLITSRGTMINETTKHSTTKTTSLTNISPAAIILVLLSMIFENTVFNIILSLHTVSSKLQLCLHKTIIIYGFQRHVRNIIFTIFFLHTIVLCRLVYSEFLKNSQFDN